MATTELATKDGSRTLKDMVRAYERELIESALSAASGNQRRAAASLGLLPTTLHEKMKRLGLLSRHAVAPALEEDSVGFQM
jgi:DNA-binding NtrC family response regulator